MNAQEARKIQYQRKAGPNGPSYEDSVKMEYDTIMRVIEEAVNATDHSCVSSGNRGFKHRENIKALKDLGYEVRELVHEDGRRHFEIHW